MTLKQCIESFGWEPEDCTPDEIREAEEELKAIEKGLIILDGVLALKLPTPVIHQHDTPSGAGE